MGLKQDRALVILRPLHHTDVHTRFPRKRNGARTFPGSHNSTAAAIDHNSKSGARHFDFYFHWLFPFSASCAPLTSSINVAGTVCVPGRARGLPSSPRSRCIVLPSRVGGSCLKGCNVSGLLRRSLCFLFSLLLLPFLPFLFLALTPVGPLSFVLVIFSPFPTKVPQPCHFLIIVVRVPAKVRGRQQLVSVLQKFASSFISTRPRILVRLEVRWRPASGI
mmetsp:Transcript_92400/g.198053  ORF Transcript_92400/g.198053 Transcript_92400/m.198053 type:complete len:220 (+) Transcript_92400:350-1009(+)